MFDPLRLAAINTAQRTAQAALITKSAPDAMAPNMDQVTNNLRTKENKC